jgi:iron uptake system EfeUOB component EfeO/EfeM
MEQEIQQRVDSRLDDVVEGEPWFTRFMRLANAMYSHRINDGSNFYYLNY